MRSIRNLIGGVGLCAPLLLPSVVSAHAFGQQFSLPLPFSLYAIGASCALLASFVAFLFFGKPAESSTRAPRIIGRFAAPYILALRIFGVVVFALTLLVGFVGAQSVTANLAPVLFWVLLLLGVTYLSVFIGGLWRLVNPFETLVRIILGKGYQAFSPYPDWFGYVPAFVFYLCLIKLELLSYGIGAVPAVLGMILLTYLVVLCIGAAIYGVDAWFTYADFFNVFFEFIGKFAVIYVEQNGEIRVRWPAEQLVAEVPQHLSALFFVMFMLSSTAFDGVRETQVWADVFYQLPLIAQNSALFGHVVLLTSPFLFFAFYAIAVYLMKVLTRTEHSFSFLLLRFAYSLIPIAIAYSFAHYFALLLNEGQKALALVSDPLGMGWNLFGTAGYQVNIGLIGAKAVWNIQIAVIVIGHIVATYIAHRIALLEFRKAYDIAIGQLPMLLLMVFYTVFGLWILSLAFALP